MNTMKRIAFSFFIIFILLNLTSYLFSSETRISALGDSFITLDDFEYDAFHHPAKITRLEHKLILFSEFRGFYNNDDWDNANKFLLHEDITVKSWGIHIDETSINRFSLGELVKISSVFCGLKAQIDYKEYQKQLWVQESKLDTLYITYVLGFKVGNFSTGLMIKRLSSPFSKQSLKLHNKEGGVGINFLYDINIWKPPVN